MKNFISNKTLIIGLGLIGGSIAKAFKLHEISREIWAFDLDFESIESAKNQQIINGIQLLDENLDDFDLIALCAPLNQYQNIFQKIHNKINSKATFFDIGSIKNFNFKNIPINFIPCHPIAGSDKTGFENSNENLFFDKKFIICKKIDNFIDSPLAKIITRLGAKPIFLESNLHDKIYGLVSHLPQFLAFLCAENNPKELPNEFMKKAFRLDQSNPQIWGEIFELNQKNLEFFYNEFYQNLEELINDIATINFSKLAQNIELPNLNQTLCESVFLNYFEKNFAPIFFRILVIISFLKINDLKKFKEYAGQGFEDFTSLICLLKFDPTKLRDLLSKNQKHIIKLFNNISN